MSANHLNSQKTSTNRHQEKLISDFDTNTMHYHLSKLFKEYSILPQKLWQHWPLVLVKHVIKTYFWALVYLVLSFLTITSTYEAYQQYRHNPVTTNMKAVINNNITYLPNMTICLKMNASELFSISSSSSFNYMSAWSRFFEETINDGIFKVNESQIYDDEIYLSLLKYLAMIYESERAWESGLTLISTFQSEESDDWIALKKVLVPIIERYNITLEQLKSVLDGKFCNLPTTSPYSFSYLLALGYGLSGERECIAGSKISFIGMETICFRLIGYQNYLRQWGMTDPLYLHLYDDGKNSTWCQEITIDLGSESRSTSRRATIPYETYGSYYNRFPAQVALQMDIGVKALYLKLPYVKGGVQCSSDTSREECENKCLREWIKESCRCSPTTFNLTTDTSSYHNCTVDDYSICLRDYAKNATDLCTYKCVPLCEQWHYEYNLVSSGDTFSSSYVQINTKTFDYIIIEQVFIWNSFGDFIGVLGSVLAVWMGLNVFVIIEFIVNLFMKIAKKIYMGIFHNSEDDNHRTSAKIEHRERSVENGISSSNTIGSRAPGHLNEYKENESEIVGTGRHQVNESEKQRESRKKKESSSLKKFLLQLTENLFWAAIYLVGVVFTILWCIDLIKLIRAEKTAYYPWLIHSRANLFPPPSLCIEYENRLLFERHGNTFNGLLDYFDQSDMDKASFLEISDGRTWPQQLVSIGLTYFSIFAAAEVNYYNVSFKSEYKKQLDRAAGYDTSLRNDIEKSLNGVLLPKLKAWNVTPNELRQKLGAELARMVELKISFTNSYETTDFVKDGSFYTAVINDEFFCYGLSNAVSFTASNDTLEFSINKALHLQLLSYSGGYIYFSDYLLEPKSATFGIQGGVPVYGSSSFPLEYGTVTNTLTSVNGLYTSRPEANGVKYCSWNTTKPYCHAQCRIELIEKLCDCSPIYWTKMIQPTSGLEECTFDRYMECLNFNYDDDLDCKDSCLPFCATKYIQSDSTHEYLSQEYRHIAVARFSLKDSIYLSIAEYSSFMSDDLLIKLRGTLGILLGFNIFSVYQILVTTITLCFAFIFKITRLTQSPSVLKSLDKIKKSGIGQFISKLNQHLDVIKSCAIMNKIKIHKTGRNILLAIGYMFGLYVAVRMCNNLYYSYKSGELKCIIDLVMNDTIKLPSSTICMPLDTVELLSKKEISNIENSIDLTRNLNFNSFYDKEEFFSEDWPEWLIRWVYEYLIIYDTVERQSTQKIISALFTDDDISASNESSNATSKYSFASLMELDKLIDHLHITISDLKQILGHKIRDIYNTTTVFMQEVDGAWEQTVLYITDTTFIGEEKICYKLPLDTVTFSSKSDYVSIFLDRGLLPNPQDSHIGKPITIDFSGRDVSKEESNSLSLADSTQTFWSGESSFAKLDISRIYEAKVNYGLRQCSKSKSMDTCLDECQQKKIERICRCSPVTRSSFLSNTNLIQCRLIDYKRCAEFLVSSDTDLCQLNCVPHCTRISFKSTTSGDRQWIESNVTNVSLTMNSFEYLSIYEVNKYTMIDFISLCGVILGLWIGLDVLTVVDLFYWLFCQCCHTFMALF